MVVAFDLFLFSFVKAAFFTVLPNLTYIAVHTIWEVMISHRIHQ